MTRFALFVVASVSLFAVACAGMQQRETLSMEDSLAAAGFQVRPADTPEKLAQLEKLPQRKMLTQEHHGQPTYLYADATDCKCLYAGGQKAYDQYQKNVASADVEDERIDAADDLPLSTSPDWLDVDAYGTWTPWW